MSETSRKPGAAQRQFFADQLRMLFAAAGRPALKKVVSEAAAVARAMGTDRVVSVQRVSDWRSGNRLPASFESVHPVLVVLIRAARDLNSEPPVTGLYSLKQWESWWTNARGQSGAPRAEKTPPSVPQGMRPYKGLASYQEKDARLFFGRTQSVRALADVVTAAHGQGPVIVTGASGVGKTNLGSAVDLNIKSLDAIGNFKDLHFKDRRGCRKTNVKVVVAPENAHIINPRQIGEAIDPIE